jgi:transposase
MTAIGIDTHKATLAACVVSLGSALAEAIFSNDPAGHRALAAWSRTQAEGATIGVEGSASYGAAAARWLVGEGFSVREVPPQLSRRERRRTRRPGKSDPGDAFAIARVTDEMPDLPPVRLADRAHDLRLLVTTREQRMAEATRVRNALHAHLLVLLPGYGQRVPNLVAASHRLHIRAELRRLEGIEAELARADLARLGALLAETKRLEQRISGLVGDHPLLRLPGVGPLVAAKLIGRAGDIRRFRSDDAFASLAGVAPIPASSGQVVRMRLDRGGDRQLNHALFLAAITQARIHPEAKAYMARKRAEGKSGREALRCLKRRLVRPVFALLVEGAQLQA